MTTLETMYPGIAFSPQTVLTANIGAGDTVITVNDISVFPAAPNFATIGIDDDGETIQYNAISGNQLSGCVRGVEGIARSWTEDSIIARNFTNEDYSRLVANINKINEFAEGVQSAAVAANENANSRVPLSMILTAPRTIYVSPAGNNITGNGSVAYPFATPQAAANSLPKHLNGHNAHIYIASGAYTSGATFIGFSGGAVFLRPQGNVAFSINDGFATQAFNSKEIIWDLSDADSVIINGNTTGGGFYSAEGSIITLVGKYGSIISIENCTRGLNASYGGLIVASSVDFHINNTYLAIASNPGGRISIENEVSGAGNINCYQSNGGIIQIGLDTLGGAAKINRLGGGQAWKGAGEDIV